MCQNPDCTLIVPNDPLSAQGLATPYQLVATNPARGPCQQNNTDQAAFVQGTILDLDTGNIFVYNPLVITRGTTPAAAPGSSLQDIYLCPSCAPTSN